MSELSSVVSSVVGNSAAIERLGGVENTQAREHARIKTGTTVEEVQNGPRLKTRA